MMTDSTTSAGGDAGRHPATATEQAVFLTVLADHLLANPNLPPVNVTMGGLPELQVHDWPDQRGTAPAGLAPWATSLNVCELSAKTIPNADWHAVRFTTRIGPGQEAQVWTRVDGLRTGDHTLRPDELLALAFGHWHQVTSPGQPVYWRRRLPGGGWLAVHKPAGSRYWQWERHEPGSREAAQTVSGFDLSRPARDAADAAVPR